MVGGCLKCTPPKFKANVSISDEEPIGNVIEIPNAFSPLEIKV
jgi:hypothetical protein